MIGGIFYIERNLLIFVNNRIILNILSFWLSRDYDDL